MSPDCHPKRCPKWFARLVLTKSNICAITCAVTAFAVSGRDVLGSYEEDFHTAAMWSAMTAVLGVLLGFRTTQAYSRYWEGSGLLHQMRAEWFDSVSCLFAFSDCEEEALQDDIHQFRFLLVRLMSMLHGYALHTIQPCSSDDFEVLDMRGLSEHTLSSLKALSTQSDKVSVMLHAIQVLITRCISTGVLKTPPPILSRTFQTLSRGSVHHSNCKKIADTPFPTTLVRLINTLIAINIAACPFLIPLVVKCRGWASLITGVYALSICSVNAAAVELEQPFGDDSVDLPLHEMQAHMNSSLLMLSNPLRSSTATPRSATAIETGSSSDYLNKSRQTLGYIDNLTPAASTSTADPFCSPSPNLLASPTTSNDVFLDQEERHIPRTSHLNSRLDELLVNQLAHRGWVQGETRSGEGLDSFVALSAVLKTAAQNPRRNSYHTGENQNYPRPNLRRSMTSDGTTCVQRSCGKRELSDPEDDRASCPRIMLEATRHRCSQAQGDVHESVINRLEDSDDM